jgi:hypothetical protein
LGGDLHAQLSGCTFRNRDNEATLSFGFGNDDLISLFPIEPTDNAQVLGSFGPGRQSHKQTGLPSA